MNYKPTAEQVQLPVKCLVQLHIHNLIQMPPSDVDKAALRLLAAVWGKTTFLKLQLANMSKANREKLIYTSDLTKIESYVLTRYLGVLIDGQRLFRAQVADELREYYKIKINRSIHHMIKQMRSRAYKLHKNPAALQNYIASQVGKKTKKRNTSFQSTQRNNTKNNKEKEAKAFANLFGI